MSKIYDKIYIRGVTMNELLSAKLIPTKLSEVLGQKHLIGENKILTNLVKNKRVFSMILYGKPGIGKTCIARAIVNELNIPYRMLNAVINNKKDFDTVVEEAKMYGGILLIMDEIHRLNKDKQDLLLPTLESGLITLIGLTTANPYHKINPAIRSRCQIFELKELHDDDILLGLKRATKSEYLKGIDIKDKELKYIVNLASGDLRFAYNLLELAYYSSSDKKVTKDLLLEINSKPIFFHDSNEDGHYDVLSAFQKSIRGSDVNASLHYLARLLEAGDLESIFRRMSVIAYEDIGLANPNIGMKVMAAIDAAERLGMPEARIPLSVVTIELALSPKSNTALLAVDGALNDIRMGNTGNVPNHIKTTSKDYKYPHNYPNAYVKQQYLPDKIKDRNYYNPKDNSQNERILKDIKEKIDNLK
jgi:putative ATPase